MAEQKSFIQYLDTAKQWEMLSDSQAGVLIKALFRYCATGEQLQTDDGMLAMAFSFITTQIDRDSKKWEKTCERRADAGKKGGRPKKQDDHAEYEESKRFPDEDAESQKSNSFSEDDEKAKKADSDSDSESDSESDINTYGADKPRTHSRSKQKFIPPTVDEVRAYCAERKNNIDPVYFVDFYTANGWVQGKGKPIRDWQATVRNWESRQPRPPEQSKGQGTQLSSIDMDTVSRLMDPYGIGSSS